MTTVIWMRGELVADTQCIADGQKIKVPKLVRLNRFVFGPAGSWDVYKQFIHKFKHSEYDILSKPIQGLNKTEVLMMSHTGVGYYLSNGHLPDKIYDKYYAIGSGAPYALGALAWGATPQEAIKVAHKFDIYTGNSVQTLYAN